MGMKHAAIIIALASCDPADVAYSSVGQSLDGGVTCPPVQTSVPVVAGAVLAENLRSFVVDNGIVRIKYGAVALDWRDQGVARNGSPVVHNQERHMDHFLEGRHTDAASVTDVPWNGLGDGDTARGSIGCRDAACHDGSGTHWHDAVYPWYGDGVAFSSGTVTQDADRVRVLRADDDAVELSYEWDYVPLDGLVAPGDCILGAYPECGPTARDHEGAAVYLHNATDVVKSVKHARLWKTVRLERCSPGYYVSIRSDPPLVWPEQGPRAARLGYVSTAVAWACDGSQAFHHPANGQHGIFAATDCIADIPQAQTPNSHEGWPFLRFMVTPRPVQFTSLQYSPTQLGSPGVRDLIDATGDDGRPEPWQAFIGAVEYVSLDLSLEPAASTLDVVEQSLPQEWPR